jgi:hypothetical protein
MAKPIAITDDQRAERRTHERQLTEQAVGQLRSSAGWQRWLTCAPRSGCGATASLS